MRGRGLDADRGWEPPRRSRRRPERGGDDLLFELDRAHRKVTHPADLLLTAWGCLGFISFGFFAVAVWALAVPDALSPGAMRERPVMLALGFTYPVAAAVGLYGAWRMRQLRSYPWAVASAGLMLVLGLVAFALGARVLTVLMHPHVRRGFRINAG